MALPKLKVQEYQVPSIADGLKAGGEYEGYTIKYFKAELDNAEEVLRLQDIETRGIMGKEIIVLERDKYSFLERYFVVVQYLEKNA